MVCILKWYIKNIKYYICTKFVAKASNTFSVLARIQRRARNFFFQRNITSEKLLLIKVILQKYAFYLLCLLIQFILLLSIYNPSDRSLLWITQSQKIFNEHIFCFDFWLAKHIQTWNSNNPCVNIDMCM